MIIDTSVLIDFLRGGGRVASFQDAFDDASISSVTAMELLEGAFRYGRNQEVIEALIERVRVIDFTADVARRAARLRSDRYADGTPLSVADSMIAASALTSSQAVLTMDVDDFKRVDELTVVPYK